MHARFGALATALPLALLLGAAPAAADCPSGRPVLNGPTVVQIGQGYSISWTPVLAQTGANDYYIIQRSPDASFGSSVDQIKTTRAAQTLPPAPAGISTLYHRIVVQTSCPSANPGILSSNTLVTRFTSDCDALGSVGAITVTPADPPAFTTYVLTWDTGVGGPGPGGAPVVTYRLRRTSSYDVRESVSTIGTASFSDAPGDYVYEVRAESSCGTVGPWSAPVIVHVGVTPVAALALVTQATPVAALSPSDLPSTQFVVRNTGTAPLSISARSPYGTVTVSPETFSLEPYQTQTLTAVYHSLGATSNPFHAAVELSAPGATLSVPIDVAVGTSRPESPVTWSATDVDVDAAGDGVLRSIANGGTETATVVSSVNKPWLIVESVDGTPWDRKLAAGETRVVRLRVDRTRRQAETGTEVGAVTLVTAGFPDEPQVLELVDDGPALSVVTGPRPDATGAKTRLIYASLPNNRDALNAGRFSSDLWLANLDPKSPIDVSLHLTPVGNDSRNLTYSFTTRLQAGETRRYRNIVAKVLGADAACELEVRSPAPTLSATALVNNTPIPGSIAAGKPRTLGTVVSPGQFGFEMRPTRPGEGVRVDDQTFVLSGIAENGTSGARRTNVLLTETSGYDTTVQLRVFDRFGADVTRGGQPILQKVPALSTIQMNADELVDTSVNYPGSLWITAEFVAGVADAFGHVHGSVVPFATVIDNVTQDASLRVGVSKAALDPLPPAATAAARRTLASSGTIPFAGGPAPLLLPAAHLIGAPLGSGSVPFWRTRVSFTNTNQTEDRALRLTFYGSDGVVRHTPIPVPARSTFTIDDLLGSPLGFDIPESLGVYGPVELDVASDASFTWKDIDVQTETYTLDPSQTAAQRGQYATGMEGFSYHHGYSSFQSNLGTVQIDGAETSARYRTNLILQEVGGATCSVAISAYTRGSFVPVATVAATLPPFGYVSKELFKGWLGLDLTEQTDVRVVVRQIDGDGVYMAFASKINLTTGDPANIFLRPALAGTGR